MSKPKQSVGYHKEVHNVGFIPNPNRPLRISKIIHEICPMIRCAAGVIGANSSLPNALHISGHIVLIRLPSSKLLRSLMFFPQTCPAPPRRSSKNMWSSKLINKSTYVADILFTTKCSSEFTFAFLAKTCWTETLFATVAS